MLSVYIFDCIELVNHFFDFSFVATDFENHETVVCTLVFGHFMQSQADFDIATKLSENFLNLNSFGSRLSILINTT